MPSTMDRNFLNSLSVAQLKEILASKGASHFSNCKKHELIRRVLHWDETNLLGSNLLNVRVVQAFSNHALPTEQWRPLSSLDRKSMGKFSSDCWEEWFKRRIATASEKKGRVLALQRFVKAIEYHDSGNGLLFFKSLCAAEMSKAKDYSVCLLVEVSTSGSTLLQANCKCPAGTGWSAACKHVAALLYNVESYFITGASMEYISKTSRPQEWGKPKPGCNVEPMCILDIINKAPLAIEVQPSQEQRLKEIIQFHVENSPLFFKTNFICEGDESIPRSAKWFSKRTRLITCSILWDIMTTVKTDNFAEGPARRQMEVKNLSKVPAIKWGLKHEADAIRAYSKATGSKVRVCGLLYSSEHNYFAGTPDGIVEDAQCVLEVKCPYSIRNQSPQEARFLTTRNGVKKLKVGKHYAQIQGQMIVADKQFGDFVVWTLKGLYIEPIIRSRSFEKRLLKDVELYWHKVFMPLLAQRNENNTH